MKRLIDLCIVLLMTGCGGPLGAATRSPAADIDAFCRTIPGVSPAKPTALAGCIAAQEQALKHYLGISVMFDAPRPQMESCMRAGKVAAHVDWTKSEACMRAWSKGRKALLPGG